jgi:hypothetical protein
VPSDEIATRNPGPAATRDDDVTPAGVSVAQLQRTFGASSRVIGRCRKCRPGPPLRCFCLASSPKGVHDLSWDPAAAGYLITVLTRPHADG